MNPTSSNPTSRSSYALVTGASAGIGRAYATELAARGYSLVMVSDRDAENRTVAEQLRQRYGVEVLPLCLDLSTSDAVTSLLRSTAELSVEVLVCNAGRLLFGGFATASADDMERLVTLHCTVPTLLCRHYGALMCQAGRGYILLMSSATAWMAYPTIALYAATKSYVRSLADALHTELGVDGVRVVAIYPGAVDTSFYRLSESWRRRLRCIGVLRTPQSVARRALRGLFRGERRVVPGLITRVVVALCRLLPHGMMHGVVRIRSVRRLLE